MSPMQYRHRNEYERVVKYTDELHELMESGEFWKLGFLERRKLVRRVNKLYRRLSGIFALRATKTVLLAAGVLALTGCPANGGGGGEGTPDGNVTITIDGNSVVDPGTTVTFTAEVNDLSEALSYQWYYNGVLLAGETGVSLTYTPDESINTAGREDFFSPRSGAPNDFEVRVDVTDAGTSETFTATIPLTVRIDPEFSSDWMFIDSAIDPQVGVFGEFPSVGFLGSNSTGGTAAIIYGDLDGDGDFDALTVSDSNYAASYYDYVRISPVVWHEQTATDGISFAAAEETGIHGASGIFTYAGEGSYDGAYSAIRPVDLVDLDGDGDADLIAGHMYYFYDGYSGDGYDGVFAATFTAFENVVVAGSPTFDLESTIDIAGMSTPILSFTQDGGGAWPTEFNDVRSNPERWFPTLKLVDFDNDGDADIVTAHVQYGSPSTRTISLRNNSGSNALPSFDAPEVLVSGVGYRYSVVSPVDIDLDGDVDIIVAEGRQSMGASLSYAYSEGAVLYENTGTPTDADISSSGTTDPFGLDFTGIVGEYTPRTPIDPVFVDLDSDGDLDVLGGWLSYEGNYYPVAFFNDTVVTPRPTFVNEVYGGGPVY